MGLHAKTEASTPETCSPREKQSITVYMNCIEFSESKQPLHVDGPT